MPGKEFSGTVTSTKMLKTLVVVVSRRYKELRTGKTVSSRKKYKIHCEDKAVKVGDFVSFTESRPYSKDKNHRFTGVLKSSEVAVETNEQ